MNDMQMLCPCCGGILRQGEDGKLACDACGNAFDAADIETMAEMPEGGSVNFAVSAQDFAADVGVRMAACPSCGAKMFCCEGTTAQCPFCGAAVSADGAANGMQPQFIVPFEISKERAEQIFADYFKGKKLLPNVFKDSKIAQMRRLYAPHWLFNCDAYADFLYDARRTHRSAEMERTEHYMVRRAGVVPFDCIPVDASRKLADSISESLEPYQFQKAVPFDPALLGDALAEVADVPVEVCQQRVTERVLGSAESAIRATVTGYDHVETKKRFVNADNASATLALLPVWVITTVKDGVTYTFAINGQTGKLTCDVPTDKGKATVYTAAAFGGSLAVIAAVMAALHMLGSGTLLIGAIVAAIISFIVRGNLVAELKQADMQSGAASYMREPQLSAHMDRFLFEKKHHKQGGHGPAVPPPPPANHGPTGHAPAGKAPANHAPAGRVPAARQPEATAPVSKAPVNHAPTGRAPAAKQPEATAPVSKAPVNHAPAGRAPAARQPEATAPVSKAPVNHAPAGRAPAARQPEATAPVSKAPVNHAPAGRVPAARQPETAAPVSKAPVNHAPAGRAPAAKQPEAEAPVSKAPVNRAPAGRAPAAKAPEAEAPVKKAPGDLGPAQRASSIRAAASRAQRETASEVKRPKQNG